MVQPVSLFFSDKRKKKFNHATFSQKPGIGIVSYAINQTTMKRIHTLEVLLDELAQCREDNGINILMIDGVSETASECIESLSFPINTPLEQSRTETLEQLSSIHELVREYKRSFDKTTRTGDPVIHRQCLFTAEHAIMEFLQQLHRYAPGNQLN